MESNNAAAPEARDVALPIFYRRPRPVDRERDRGWSLQPTPDVRYARATNSVLLGAAEFARAMHSYPIVFTSTEPRVAVAVLGLDGDQNLFVGEDGKWREGNYIPAYVSGSRVWGIEPGGTIVPTNTSAPTSTPTITVTPPPTKTCSC